MLKSKWIVAMAIVAALGACKKEETTTDTAVTTDTMATDTAATAPATDTFTSMSDTMATSGTAAPLSAEDKDFVSKAGMGGMAEVQMGNLALQKASNADVKAFGQRMVTDHSAANAELSQLATTKGVMLPTALEGEHKTAADHLASLSGKEFDKAYMEHMVSDHEKDVSEFQKASTSAQDSDVKGWAAKTLPTLQQHLQLAKDTKAKLK
jgi:putative membrane protein